jgi:CspA family cold shock protein
MPIGTVKWFSNITGYGFLNASDVEEDIFVHYSAIEMDGYKKLKSGQTVEFELTDGPRGLQAINIRPRSDDSQD